MKPFNRPSFNGCDITTPRVKEWLKLLGSGEVYKGLALTKDEFKSIKGLYGYEEETHPLLQAGASRDSLRDAEKDGLRMVAWLSKFIDKGQDPLKALVVMASDAGYDVDYEDNEWAFGNDSEETPE